MLSEARPSLARPLSRSLEIGLVGAILLLAVALRMGWPGLTEFKADEARLLTLSLDMAQGLTLPTRGIASSVGFPNFPMSVWLYAIPLFLWQHVYAATLFTGLVNSLAVVGCWWLVRRYWGPAAALIALLFFAVNPWAVFHARKIWAQNLLPPVVVGWGLAAVLGFVERRPRFIILHLLALAIAVQVHFAALALLPATLLLLLLFRRRLALRPLLLGVGLSTLTVLPFAHYLLSQGGPRLSGAGNLLARAGEEAGAGLTVRSWHYLLLLTTGREIHSLAGPDLYREYLASLPPLAPVHWLWVALTLAGVLWLLWRARLLWTSRHAGLPPPPAAIAPPSAWSDAGRRQTEAGLIVLIWLFFPSLVFTWFPVEVVLHYILPAYPAPFIAAGVAAALLLGRLGRWRHPVWILLILTAGIQLWAIANLLGLVTARATPGGFGTPLAMKLAAVETATQMQADLGASELLIAGMGEDPATDSFAAVYDALLHDTPHRFVDVTRSALFPESATIVLLASEPTGGAAPLYLEAASSRREIPLRRGEGVLQVLTLPPGSAPQPEQRFDPTHLFANWIDLYGYSLPSAPQSEQLVWRLFWHPGANPDPAGYHFFNHLLNAGGEQVSQADAAVFSPEQWQPGDTVVSHFQLSLPPGTERPLTVRAGVYRYPGLENVPLLDVAGNPYAAAVEVELEQ